jgi:superfamily I DNA and/or RNA helicase
MICELVAQGKRVGITATSHKVIRSLLDKCVDKATKKGIPLRAAHKNKEDEPAGPDDGRIVSLSGNDEPLNGIRANAFNVVGGTAWLWAREDYRRAVDVLFVDEAGQMALANVVAVSQAADSVVLLGDPQQLDQPTQGTHPDGVGVSALRHLLGEQKTISSARGIFLPTTWRLAPSICRFTSELYYERKLESKAGLEHQELVNAREFDGSGLRLIEVEHDGNRNQSPEEVKVIADLVARLTSADVRWRDGEGNIRPVGVEQILVVSPYNAQVNLLAEALPGAHIGTVDKFQGQQAPVVIYSMATSRPEDAPRGMEFLYSPNRLNVATSRAQCTVILVASPHLFRPECRSVRQIKLANGLCRFRELAVPVSTSSRLA